MTILRFLLGWSAIYLALTVIAAMAGEASTLARHRRGPRDRRHTVRRPAPHVHVWVLEEGEQYHVDPLDPTPALYAHRLVWTCQTCPHREYLGLAWPDASNRTAA